MSPPEAMAAPSRARDAGRGALFVAAGIFLSKIVGLVRLKIFAFYFGNSMYAAAFSAALRIPNMLQNLLGEGVLSGSFIPVYASLLGRGDKEQADKVAGAVFGLLSLLTAVLVALGVTFTRPLIGLLAGGFERESQELTELTITLVRILFPGTGILVLSAWCLGVLNSHRRFFLSYASPVVWNAAIIAALLIFSGADGARHIHYVTWGVVIGSALQLGVQLPSVLRLMGGLRPAVGLADEHVRTVLSRFGPVVVGRGVVQLSALVDLSIASYLTSRAVSALNYAQTLYLLPVALFGMSIAAAELPEMAREAGGGDEAARALAKRIETGLERIAFFVVPSAVAFIGLGDVVSAVLQGGNYGAADSRYGWYLLAPLGVSLVAATQGRLYSSGFYALKDTRRPLYFAVVRVVVGATLALLLARGVTPRLAVPLYLGAIGISAASAFAAWLEFLLLRRSMDRRTGPTRLSVSRQAWLWGAALVSCGVGLGVKWLLVRQLGPAPAVLAEWGGAVLPAPRLPSALLAAVVLIPFGLAYFAITYVGGVPQSRGLFDRVLRRGRR